MKKIITLLVAFLAMNISALADEITQDVSKLPESARNFISTNFPNAKIAGIEIDRNFFFVKDYETFLSDGTVIDFNSRGEMTSVKNKLTGVPAGLINKNISAYVASKYPNQKIVSMELKKCCIEIELSSDVDLVFDCNGNFIKID
ncbi:MAG: hypothetical protein E7036_08365 [Opitutales bacterium]|nr:hypothetical protein [Opitutales bacterium]MBP3357921.1 PepSY-like domain-containing protein [Opitutales bacterium]